MQTIRIQFVYTELYDTNKWCFACKSTSLISFQSTNKLQWMWTACQSLNLKIIEKGIKILFCESRCHAHEFYSEITRWRWTQIKTYTKTSLFCISFSKSNRCCDAHKFTRIPPLSLKLNQLWLRLESVWKKIKWFAILFVERNLTESFNGNFVFFLFIFRLLLA